MKPKDQQEICIKTEKEIYNEKDTHQKQKKQKTENRTLEN